MALSSKGLGHEVFILKSGVRIPGVSPKLSQSTDFSLGFQLPPADATKEDRRPICGLAVRREYNK